MDVVRDQPELSRKKKKETAEEKGIEAGAGDVMSWALKNY